MMGLAPFPIMGTPPFPPMGHPAAMMVPPMVPLGGGGPVAKNPVQLVNELEG